MMSKSAWPFFENCGGGGGLLGTRQFMQLKSLVLESDAQAPLFVIGAGTGVGGTTTSGSGCEGDDAIDSRAS
jgi:hypothetical protein